VETLYGDGLVSLFLVGAAGDQAPIFKARRAVPDKDGRLTSIDIGDQGYLLVDLLGERLAQDVVRTSEKIGTLSDHASVSVSRGSALLKAQARPKALQDLRPTRAYAFQPAGDLAAPFVVLRLGDMALVGVQVELSSETGRQIKLRSPFKHTIVATMVDGAAKYMPDAASYEKITYESMNSSYARGSAEALSDEIVGAMKP
jgi:neutral ceramidase